MVELESATVSQGFDHHSAAEGVGVELGGEPRLSSAAALDNLILARRPCDIALPEYGYRFSAGRCRRPEWRPLLLLPPCFEI